MLRTILAFVLAPIPAASIMAAYVAFRPRPGRGIFEHPASMFLTLILLLYALAPVIGVPAFLFLRRTDQVSLRAHALAGALMTLIPIGLMGAWGLAIQRVSLREVAFSLLWYGLLGLLTGATFWLIARPDRHARMGKGRAGKANLSRTFD